MFCILTERRCFMTDNMKRVLQEAADQLSLWDMLWFAVFVGAVTVVAVIGADKIRGEQPKKGVITLLAAVVLLVAGIFV